MSNELDAAQQKEEIEAVQAIFGDDFSFDNRQNACKIRVGDGVAAQLEICAILPADYPSAAPPSVQLVSCMLPEQLLNWAAAQLEAMFTPGAVVLYDWTEWVRAQEVLWPAPCTAPSGSTAAVDKDPGKLAAVVDTVDEHQHLATTLQSTEIANSFFHGTPFTEKKSTFQAHLVAISSVDEVPSAMAILLSNNKVQRATHNIMAYRIHNEQLDTFSQDCDDDGEDAAGRRLLHLLQVVDARNVIVVVSRWFGGVLLGPARFTHINNAARALLQECGYVGSAEKDKVKQKSRR